MLYAHGGFGAIFQGVQRFSGLCMAPVRDLHYEPLHVALPSMRQGQLVLKEIVDMKSSQRLPALPSEQ